MKRTRIMGLCLVAVCAIFALTASSSLATFNNLPHYGKCVATPGGKFKASGCTKLAVSAEEHKYEWEPLTTTVTFKSKKEVAEDSGKAVLEPESERQITCNQQQQGYHTLAEGGGGEYGPGDQVKNVVGEFSECELSGFKCNSEGKPLGTIWTKKLDGEPGIIDKSVSPTKSEKWLVGNDLVGQGKTDEEGELANFNCEGVPVVVKGGVVIAAHADSTGGSKGEYSNKMANKIEVEFIAAKKGIQQYKEWEPNGAGISHTGGPGKLHTENLKSSLEGGPFERSGQSLITVQATDGTKPKLELRMCEDFGSKAVEC
jgi:hypothetical protein